MRNLRSLVVRLVTVSFSLAALLGIVTLLAGDTMGETGSRVLGTTFVVGVESLAVLCYLSVAGTRRALLGVLGGLVSLVPFCLVLWLIWADSFGSDGLWRTFSVGLTLAASLAQASLLAAVTDRPRPRVAPLLAGTYAAIVVLAAMVCYAIIAPPDGSDWYWRILGIVAILDVLGTLLVIALQRFTGDGADGLGPSPISASAQARLAAAAQQRGTTPSALLEDLLDGLPDA